MKLRDLIQYWQRSAAEQPTARQYAVRLPLPAAARLAALAELYPGRSEEDLITDLLTAALDELEAQFPYIPGSRIVAEDDHGDPVYEDTGLTPRFQALVERHLGKMRQETGGTH